MFASKTTKAPADASMRMRHTGSREHLTRKTDVPMSSPGQAKLSVGRRDHPLEHEAHRIASQIVRSPESTIRASRSSLNPAGHGVVHDTKESGHRGPLFEAPPVVNEVLREEGHSLDPIDESLLRIAVWSRLQPSSDPRG